MRERVRKVLDETAAARNDVLALATGLSAEQLNRPTVNEGWSIKDALAHLAGTEARQRLIPRTVLDGGTWSAGREERDAYNARCVAERRARTPDAVIAELRDTGRETANLFGRLTPEELDREWDHPIFGRMTIERTAQITAQHLRSHAEELRTALGRWRRPRVLEQATGLTLGLVTTRRVVEPRAVPYSRVSAVGPGDVGNQQSSSSSLPASAQARHA